MKLTLSFILIGMVVLSCTSTTPNDPAVFDATPFVFDPMDLPMPPLPTDYPLTVARVRLGRMLFFDARLSRDGSQSCATCHQQSDGFSDKRTFSIGVKGLAGHRQAMPIVNLAWHRNGFFWDGRAPTLRDQALRPIQDTLEMDETLPRLVAKLGAIDDYRSQFIRAFGSDTITAARVGIALEQFMLTIVSGDSKFDKVVLGNATLSAQEERGRLLYFREFDPTFRKKGAECFHCHGGPNLTNDRYMNNGLDNDASFVDLGQELVTGLAEDRAKFKVPTLRNIAVTAPFMHDGRFNTLEEVVDHYNTGAKNSSTVDPLMQFLLEPGLQLNTQDKEDLVAFIKTFTDDTFLRNRNYARP